MKVGIVLLLLLGLVAAACAAVLVGAVKFNPFASDPNDVPGYEVVVAGQSLPAMTIVTADHIEKRVVTKAELPLDRGRLFSEAAAIGRVLAVSVVNSVSFREEPAPSWWPNSPKECAPTQFTCERGSPIVRCFIPAVSWTSFLPPSCPVVTRGERR
jgi:hypothetical protein